MKLIVKSSLCNSLEQFPLHLFCQHFFFFPLSFCFLYCHPGCVQVNVWWSDWWRQKWTGLKGRPLYSARQTLYMTTTWSCLRPSATNSSRVVSLGQTDTDTFKYASKMLCFWNFSFWSFVTFSGLIFPNIDCCPWKCCNLKWHYFHVHHITYNGLYSVFCSLIQSSALFVTELTTKKPARKRHCINVLIVFLLLLIALNSFLTYKGEMELK